ncbi:hypothetical protein TNCV_987011 [Trichonephila clavipes]|nr:hypothetical protein TNCV_987011 [Trichonephila clavipes]
MKDEIGGTGWKGVDGGERRKGWMGRTAGRGGGDGENSFGEAGTSSTSAPRDPEPPRQVSLMTLVAALSEFDDFWLLFLLVDGAATDQKVLRFSFRPRLEPEAYGTEAQ